MSETCAVWEWREVGRGFLEGYLKVNAVRQFRGLVVLWQEMALTLVYGQVNASGKGNPIGVVHKDGVEVPQVPIIVRCRLQCDVKGRRFFLKN